jgi:hypothetical protein
MPELSLHHIDQISRDISREEISFSHLLEDLIDHVCCDVEYEMQNGLNFSEAYQRVKQKMGPRRIRDIQKETLYAVDTKYRIMKNTMKISGITGTVLLAFAAFFKIQHWPLAGIMLVLGALCLAFVFMPSALVVLWKETHNRKRIFLFVSAFLAGFLFIFGIVFKVQHWSLAGALLTLAAIFGVLFFVPSLLTMKLSDERYSSKKIIYILGSIALVFYILGLLFKVQHWFGATFLMMLGLSIIFFVVFPWFTWVTWRNDKSVNIRFIFMVIASLAVVLPSALITLNLQRTFDEGFYLHQQQAQELFRDEFSNNATFLKTHTGSEAYPILSRIHSRTDSLLNIIYSVESGMIAESEGGKSRTQGGTRQISINENGTEIQFNLLKSPFNAGPVINFLKPDCSTRMILDSALQSYVSYLSSLPGGIGLKKFEKLLDSSVYLKTEDLITGKVSLMSGLHSLGLLKNSILAVESNAFLAVSSQK